MNAKACRQTQWLAAWLAILLLWPVVALADCRSDDGPQVRESLASLRLDNDLFSGTGRDGGYTSGALATWVSPLPDGADADCLPSPLGWLARNLRWLQPQGGDQTSVRASVGLALFTPTDREARVPVPNDRPYAAVLLFGVGFDARSGDRLRSTHLRFGMVGPSLRAEQIQNGIHHLIGAQRFRGWDHQLRDEPVVQLLHERLHRWDLHGSPDEIGSDLIAHWGGSLGNLLTFASAGAQWRIGRRLPKDFGSDPLRPAGDAVALPRANAADTVHLFVSTDLRAVARNLTLDGNTWRDSHRVDKRGLVGELGLGVAWRSGRWRLELVRHVRSREFEGQKARTDFGTLRVSAAL